MKCVWPPGPLDSQTIEIDILPCLKPPAIRILVSNAKEGHYFNHTFDKPEIVKLHMDVKLNVTVTHPGDELDAIGLEVTQLNSF